MPVTGVIDSFIHQRANHSVRGGRVLGPIFYREVVTVPRRDSHYLARFGILMLLWVLGLTAWQATVGFDRNPTLGEAARFGLLLFQIITFLLLTLLLFFSALSAASAVSQEKDRRTLILLLLTDMRDSEIVLGKLLGSLLPILLLLLTTVPVLVLLLLLGGISAEQVFQATLLLLATSVAAGSLGGLVALWRERTFQSLALSVLFLVFYLLLAQGVSLLETSRNPTGTDLRAWIEPFSALQSVLEPPREASGLAPVYGFALLMLLWTILLNGLGVYKLRRWNPSGEPIQQREQLTEEEIEKIDRAKAHAAPGKVRDVWRNPILWREIRTLAYGRKPLMVKLAYGVVLTLIGWYAVSLVEREASRPSFVAAYGMVPIVVLSMLLISAQAVTSITSERDGGALDLLLVTDLSPYDFVFGKLGGVLYNTKEYFLPPFLFAVYYALEGVLTNTPKGLTSGDVFLYNFGPLLCLAGALLVLLSFVMVLGLHVALRMVNSRLAIVHTLGTVFFLSVGTLICIYLIVINGGSFANQWLSFLAFLFLGIGGFWWVLSGDRPSSALSLASVLCPLAMFYCVTNILIAKPGSEEATDPFLPFLVIGGSFGFAIAAMLVPLLSEFDVALGRTNPENLE